MAREETRGGREHLGDAVLMVEDPLERAHVDLERILQAHSSSLPPAAIASWDKLTLSEPYLLTPPPVCVGTETVTNQPFVLPAEGVYSFGNPKLLQVSPIPPVDLGGKNKIQKAALEEGAIQRANDREIKRFAVLDRESLLAADFAKMMATRVFASTLPGLVNLTVYAPGQSRVGDAFVDFGPLYSSRTSFADLLNNISEGLAARKQATGHAQQYPTRMVVIFGSGMPMKARDRVAQLVDEASKYGFFFILHGLDIPCNKTPVALGRDNQLMIPDLDIPVKIDEPPAPEVVRRITETTVAGVHQRRQGTALGFTKNVWDNNQYRHDIKLQTMELAILERTLVEHRQRFPWLHRDFYAKSLPEASKQYYEHIDLALDGKLRKPANQPQPVERLAVGAALALEQSYFGHEKPRHASSLPGTLWTEINVNLLPMASLLDPPYARDARGQQVDALLYRYLTDLAEAMPLEASGWAFQLLADRAAKMHWQTKSQNNQQVPWQVVSALSRRFQSVYGCRLKRDSAGGVMPEDQGLANCLSACHLLDLHRFHDADQDQQAMLVRYVELAIRRFDRSVLEQKAPIALATYDLSMDVLKRIGVNVTLGERVQAGKAELLGHVVTASNWAKALGGQAVQRILHNKDGSSEEDKPPSHS